MGIDPISIGLMAAGTLVGLAGQGMSFLAQQNQLKAKQRMANVEAQNARLEQVRQARIAHARIIQAGENQGAGGSSSVVGGAQGATNQGESNIQYINDQFAINQQIIKAQKQEVNGQGVTQLGAGMQNIGGTIFANAPYLKQKWPTIFGDSPEASPAPNLRGSFGD